MYFQIFPKTFQLYQQGLTEKYSEIKEKQKQKYIFKNYSKREFKNNK